MTVRIAASVGYAGGTVGVEVDVSYVTDKVPSDSSPTGWRNDDGTFASAPSVSKDEIRQYAHEAKETAAANVRSQELARELQEAEVSVEDWEEVETRPHGVSETVRIDPDGTGDWVEYVPKGRRLERR